MNEKPGQVHVTTELPVRFADQLNTIFARATPQRLGVAVSGGGDSMALLALLLDWAKTAACQIHVVTVNHGLRDAAAREAEQVAEFCQHHGVPHSTLNWTQWDGNGNMQQAARQARYLLMSAWAAKQGITDILLGHTRDDQAETVLMRLARGSGVDGLSAMSKSRTSLGIEWHRPLLDFSRGELRDYLEAHQIPWNEDPSNEDVQYERVRTRKALGLLKPLGITAQGLAETAIRMASAREVLDQQAADLAEEIVEIRHGAVFFTAGPYFGAAHETARRLLSAALCWVSGNQFGPRGRALAETMQRVEMGEMDALHGCLIMKTKEHVLVTREPNAVSAIRCEPDQLWDGRWQMQGPSESGFHIAMTGDKGLETCENWRDTGLPRAVVLAAPAVWRGREILAAPVAGWPQGWQAKTKGSKNDFVRTLLSH